MRTGKLFGVDAIMRASVFSPSTIMSLEAARDLSIPELLRVLNGKLGLEQTRLRKYHPPPAFSTTSLEAEVSVPSSARPQRTWRRDLAH